jgi:hypothetical protein
LTHNLKEFKLKAIRVLKIVLKDTIMSGEKKYLEEAIEEIEELQKNKFNEFEFTSCNDCKHKINKAHTIECSNCKRFYSCKFERE